MRGARSGQAAGAALRKYSTPLAHLGWPGRSLALRRPVLARRFPLWTTPIAAPALSGAGQSAPPLLSGSNREDKARRSSRRSARRVPQSPGSAPNQVGREWLAHGAKRSSQPSPCRLRTWGPYFAVRFGDLISSRGPDHSAPREEVEVRTCHPGAISPPHPVATVRDHGELRFSVVPRERSSNRSSQ